MIPESFCGGLIRIFGDSVSRLLKLHLQPLLNAGDLALLPERPGQQCAGDGDDGEQQNANDSPNLFHCILLIVLLIIVLVFVTNDYGI